MADLLRLLSNDLEVQIDVGKTLVLGNPVWDDLRVELTSTLVPAVAGPDFAQFKDNGSGSTGVFLYWFDKTTEEQAYFTAQMPHGQMLDTDISPHIHWTPAANGSADAVVNWGLEYTWAEVGQTFGNTSIVYANSHTPADASLVAGKHYISAFDDIRGHTHTVSNILVCRLFRDAGGAGGTDDYDNDAGAMYVDLHFQKDTLGSRTEFAK